jgi:hypothetical protein
MIIVRRLDELRIVIVDFPEMSPVGNRRLSKVVRPKSGGGPGCQRAEMDALVRASEQLSCKDLLLINDEEEGDETVHQNGPSRKVTIIPLWKWLLTPPPRAASS